MTAASSSQPRLFSGSLARAFARHTLILAIAAGATFVLARAVSPQEQPLTWIVAGVVAGLLASILVRGPTGLASLTVGYAVGLLVEFQWRAGGWPTAAELAELPIHLAALAAAALAYVTGRLAWRLYRARRW